MVRARLGATRRNSGKPRSSDGPGVKPHPQGQRTPCGRQGGGQPGHVGRTLRLVAEPDEVQVHGPFRCQTCGQSLEDILAIQRDRRQVVDIPPVNVRVIEHQPRPSDAHATGPRRARSFHHLHRQVLQPH